MDTSVWFYLFQGKREGPVDLESLAAALCRHDDPLATLVWRRGMAGWTAAGQVEELSLLLPPPIPTSGLVDQSHLAGEPARSLVDPALAAPGPTQRAERTPTRESLSSRPQSPRAPDLDFVAPSEEPGGVPVAAGEPRTQPQELSGVGGWLLFLCVSLTIINPLGIFAATADLLRVWPMVPYPGRMALTILLMTALGIWSLIAGIQLWTGNPAGVRMTRWLLWTLPMWALLEALLGFVYAQAPLVADPYELELRRRLGLDRPDYGPALAALGVAFSAVISAVIWTAYLNRSVRVANTYSLKRRESRPSPSHG